VDKINDKIASFLPGEVAKVRSFMNFLLALSVFIVSDVPSCAVSLLHTASR
jgi:hypothetical protein